MVVEKLARLTQSGIGCCGRVSALIEKSFIKWSQRSLTLAVRSRERALRKVQGLFAFSISSIYCGVCRCLKNAIIDGERDGDGGSLPLDALNGQRTTL